MSDNNDQITNLIRTVNPPEKEHPRKPYKKPLLEDLGDLRAITLGPSPGIPDSGGFGPPF